MRTTEASAPITLLPNTEARLNAISEGILIGTIHYEQLPPALRQFWTFAYDTGRDSLAQTIAQLEHECNRLYFEVTIRQPKPQGEYISWADLQKRRAEREAEAAGNYPGGDLRAAWGITT